MSKETRVIAEKIFESIGMENSNSELMQTRIAVKNPHLHCQNNSATSANKRACDDTKSIIVSLKNAVYTKDIVRRKSLHPNLKSSLVFPKTKTCSKINLNHLYAKNFYNLFLDIRSFLRSKGLLMPKIHNNNKTVVKMDNNHPSIIIKERTDLDNFILSF